MQRRRRYWLSVGLVLATGWWITPATSGAATPLPSDTISAAEQSAASHPLGVGQSGSETLTLLAQGGPPPGRGPGGGMGRGAGRGPGRGLGGGGFGPDPQFAQDRDVFHFLLSNHTKITRQVKLLDNGVETVTESDDPAIAEAIRKHVQAMYQRVEQVRPIRLRDPLFAAVFQHAKQIELRLEPTDKGIHVTETSADPFAVRLIQAHAAVVDGFVQRGFAEAQRNHEVPAGEVTAGEAPAGDAATGRASATSSPIDVQQVFAAFDQAYIPALALTNQDRQQAAERALERLRQAWSELSEQLDPALKDDPQWTADQQAVRDAIGAAARELSANRLAAAHETLEELRGRLGNLRQRHQWTYDLDALNAFHETMEKIARPALETTADQVNQAAQRDLRGLLQTAQQQWSVVEQLEFSRSARNMDDAAYERLQDLVRLQRQALSALETALDTGDAEQILQAARGIKPPFAQLYMSFGDFPAAAG